MLLDTIKADMKHAMKAGEKGKVSALRMLLAAVKNRQISLQKELDDQEILAVIRTQCKQITESYEQFSRAGRDDLARKEAEDLAVTKVYLPKELGEDEIKSIVSEIISEMNATKKDFGKVMKLAMSRVAGRADGKAVNSIVSLLLK